MINSENVYFEYQTIWFFLREREREREREKERERDRERERDFISVGLFFALIGVIHLMYRNLYNWYIIRALIHQWTCIQIV